jgi:PAS domain S-box-containing protein
MPSKGLRREESAMTVKVAHFRSLASARAQQRKPGPKRAASRIRYDIFAADSPGLIIVDCELRLGNSSQAEEQIRRSVERLVAEVPAETVPLLAPVVGPIQDSLRTLAGQSLPISRARDENRDRPGRVRQWRTSVFPVRREGSGGWRFGALAVEITDEQQFEKIRKSQALLAQAEQVARLGSWEFDELTGEVTWSDSLCRICGLDPAQTKLSKELCLQVLHPDDREMVRSIVEWGTKDRQMFEHEARYVLPDGRQRVLFTRGKPCFDESGRVVKWIGVSQDITERKEAERALLENEARLRALVGSIDEVVFEMDAEGTFLNIWARNEGMLVRPRTEMLGRRSADLTSEEFFRPFREVSQRVLRTGQAENFEYPLRVQDGARWYLGRVSPILAADGTYKSVCLMARDITERKRAEEALRQKEATIRALFQISKILTSTLEIGTILDTLICEAMELVGAEQGWSGLCTARGLVCRKYFQGKVGERMYMLWRPGEGIPGRVLLDKLPYRTNTADLDPLVSPEMRERFGVRHVLCVPVLDACAEVIAVFSLNNKKESAGFTPADVEVVVGISQVASIALQNALAYRKIRRTERELRRLSGRLLQSQDQERRNIARELHDQTAQSLGALHMNLERLAATNGLLSPAQHAVVDESLEITDQSIQEVRTLSYLLHPPLLDEEGLAAALPWYVSGFCERSGIDIRVEIPEDFGRLPPEQEMTIFRLVQECLSNIRRHSGSRWGRIRLERSGDSAVLEVTDSGCGMVASAVDAGAHSLARCGVGISGMRERVKQFHGSFEIKSAPEQGTTVRVVLPVRPLPGA